MVADVWKSGNGSFSSAMSGALFELAGTKTGGANAGELDCFHFVLVIDVSLHGDRMFTHLFVSTKLIFQ